MYYNIPDLPPGTILLWLGRDAEPQQQEVAVIASEDDLAGRLIIIGTYDHLAIGHRASWPTIASDSLAEAQASLSLRTPAWYIAYLPRPVTT